MLFLFLKKLKQILLSRNDAKNMSIIFLNKSKLGNFIASLERLKERKIQTIKLTITEDKIIPTTPKLYGERFPKSFIGAPIKNQSKKALNMIPANDN